jgi:hypothetical protein
MPWQRQMPRQHPVAVKLLAYELKAALSQVFPAPSAEQLLESALEVTVSGMMAKAGSNAAHIHL